MGVYLPNMEMPKSCPSCPFNSRAWYEESHLCLAKNEQIKVNLNTGFDDNCPLVNVPPHGRLGDLDALAAKAIERSEKCGVWVNVLDKVITAYDIETAPTVIPASEEGE